MTQPCEGEDVESDSPPTPRKTVTAQPERLSTIETRIDLIQALCDAAQLEHGLCCAYLFAALSLKRSSEEGVPQVKLAELRNWESVLLLISRQEMEHLGIVSNLLTAVGGMPYLQNPVFPVKADRFGELPELPLERFSKETIQRLLKFEKPEWVHLRDVILERVRLAKNYDEALSIVRKQICAEMEWAAGDLWVPDGDTFVPVLRVTGELKVSYDSKAGKDIWSRWQTPHPPTGQEFNASQNADSNIVNTCVEIPTYRGTELTCVWRFFYETFRSFDEDDSLAQSIELLLTDPRLNSALDGSANRPRPAVAAVRLSTPEFRYATIGGFYRQIRKGFLRMCFQGHKPTGYGLFTGFQTGNPDIGISDRNVHDIDLATVSGLDSALAAIEQIIETGEASLQKHEDSHYLRLLKLQKDVEAATRQSVTFEPAREVVTNPVTVARVGCTLLTHPDAVSVAEIFDAVYEISLQMIARFFAFPDDKVLKVMAFGPLMTMAMRPLAEMLGQLNAGDDPKQKAGPPFQSPARDILHPHKIAAWTVFGERLQQIATRCSEVEASLKPEHKEAGQRLTFIGKNINYISSRLTTAAAEAKKGGAPAPVAGN